MTDFGNSVRLELATREQSSTRAYLLPGNFASDVDLSATSRRELSSLKTETDPELLALGLLRWAGREESDQRAASATLAYQYLSENPDNLNLSDEVRQKAKAA